MFHDSAPAPPVSLDYEWNTPPYHSGRMYAISFHLDAPSLREIIGLNLHQAYSEIKKILRVHGFKWQQRSVFFGDMEKVNAVTCTVAALALAQALPWFADAVRDLRMIRVEEQTNLMPVVRHATGRDEVGMCLAGAGPNPYRKFPAATPSEQIIEM